MTGPGRSCSVAVRVLRGLLRARIGDREIRSALPASVGTLLALPRSRRVGDVKPSAGFDGVCSCFSLSITEIRVRDGRMRLRVDAER